MARGQRIDDRCEVRAPISHGAMREVWECTDLHLRRLVVLNFIRPELLDSDDERQRIVRRFRREIAALAGVDHSHVDHRADLYSPGCLLYFILTEEPPFTTPIPALVMLAHRTSPPPALASFRHDVPPDLEDLVLRLLAKHPGERHADATSVESLLALHIPASAPDASWDSFPDPGMDIARPSRFPACARPLATRVDKRARGRR